MICVAVVLGELGVDDCSDVVANFGLDEESSFEFEPGTKDSSLDDGGLDVIRSLFSGGASIILFVKLGLLTLAANSLTWSAADNDSWPDRRSTLESADNESADDLFSCWLLWIWHWHPEAVHLA